MVLTNNIEVHIFVYQYNLHRNRISYRSSIWDRYISNLYACQRLSIVFEPGIVNQDSTDVCIQKLLCNPTCDRIQLGHYSLPICNSIEMVPTCNVSNVVRDTIITFYAKWIVLVVYGDSLSFLNIKIAWW